MNEEEYQKHSVCRGKCDASDNVDGLSDPYGVWWHFTLVAAVASVILILLKQKNKIIIITIF